jgi:hypothetical protein
MQMDSKGYVITASLSSIRKINCDEIWLITKVEKNIPGVKWMPELAPNGDLYNKYLCEWKGGQEKNGGPNIKKNLNCNYSPKRN